MKSFNVFVGPQHAVEAVKQGWSWPGFFFGWIWCFIKGLPVIGLALLVTTLVMNFALPDTVEMAGVSFALGLGIMLWLGSSGNDLVERKLKQVGFQFAATVEAQSPDRAEEIFRADPVAPPEPQILEPIGL